MKPGPGLDEQVVLAMGWRTGKKEVLKRGLQWTDCWYDEIGGYIGPYVPKVSTDLSCAVYHLYPWLKKNSSNRYISLYSLENRFTVTLAPPCSSAISIEGETEAHALCLMVLRVQELESEKEQKRMNGGKPDFKNGDILIVKKEWDREGTTMKCLGEAVFKEQWWVPVDDPEMEDPTFYKANGLMKSKKG